MNSEPVALSVLIACRNGATTLEETLQALVSQRWDRPWEIVLADNGSTDGSVALFEAVTAANPAITMRMVNASAEQGKPFALNTGIAAARGVALAVCDADDVPGTGWVAAMGEALVQHPIVACRFDYDRLNSGWVRSYRGSFQEHGLEPLPFLPHFVHAGGGSMGFQRAVIDRVGLFDPEFRFLEDTEFCVRAQLAGFSIHFLPEAVMHVRSRADLNSIFRQSYEWGHYEMKLVARYRNHGVPFAGGISSFLHQWWRVLRSNLRRGLRPTHATMVDAARLRNRTGRLTGNLMSMLQHRVWPYRN